MDSRRFFVGVTCIILVSALVFTPQGITIASPGDGEDNPVPTLVQDEALSSGKKFDRRDIPLAVEYMATYEKHGLPAVEHKAQLAPLDVDSSFIIQPILFIANDLAENAANQPAINGTFQQLQRWYSGALELNNSGYTFELNPTVVFHAPQPFAYYQCPDHVYPCGSNYGGIWGNVQMELFAANYPLWSPGVSYIVFVKGAGGWAGSNNNNSYTNWPAPGPASTGGFGILGDWALDAISGTTNPACEAIYHSACYQDPQRGAVGHELGHTLGLAHANEQSGSIMLSWWDFPFTGLFGVAGNDEQSVLRNDSPFFSPRACTPDAQVKSTLMPARVKTGTQFTASFTVTNFGFCHWAPTSTVLYQVSNNVWGLSQQALGQEIKPAQPYTFTLSLKAPLLSRKQSRVTYDCYWQLRFQAAPFGPKMGGRIAVTK